MRPTREIFVEMKSSKSVLNLNRDANNVKRHSLDALMGLCHMTCQIGTKMRAGRESHMHE